MQARLSSDRRPLALDGEAFADMVGSRAFATFRDRVRQALATTAADCERENDALKLRRAQGQAAALRMVLGLPEQMMAENEKGKRT